jgi:hypothetical protein
VPCTFASWGSVHITCFQGPEAQNSVSFQNLLASQTKALATYCGQQWLLDGQEGLDIVPCTGPHSRDHGFSLSRKGPWAAKMFCDITCLPCPVSSESGAGGGRECGYALQTLKVHRKPFCSVSRHLLPSPGLPRLHR